MPCYLYQHEKMVVPGVISTSGSHAYVTKIGNGTSKIYSDVTEEKGGREPILGSVICWNRLSDEMSSSVRSGS